jgi:hypothetical protein
MIGQDLWESTQAARPVSLRPSSSRRPGCRLIGKRRNRGSDLLDLNLRFNDPKCAGKRCTFGRQSSGEVVPPNWPTEIIASVG